MMGLFKSKEQRLQEKRAREQKEAEARLTAAKNYAREERISVDDSLDIYALQLVYDALQRNSDVDTSHSTLNDENELFSALADELNTVDCNLYRFLKAVIYQNFMLMRKIDKLDKRIEDLEKS